MKTLRPLLRALDRHGDRSGTEAQLDETGFYLRQAVGLLTPTQRARFFSSNEVRTFVRNQKGKT